MSDRLNTQSSKWRDIANALDEVDDAVLTLCHELLNVNPKIQLGSPSTIMAWNNRMETLYRVAESAIQKAKSLAWGMADPLIGWVANPGKIEADIQRWLYQSTFVIANIHGLLTTYGPAVVNHRELIEGWAKEIRDPLKEHARKIAYFRSPPIRIPLSQTPPDQPHPGDDLIQYLTESPNERTAVAELPEGFLNPNMLTVADADGLIEFGHRNHCFCRGKTIVESGWNFVSVTGPKCKPMKQILEELLAFDGDERIREHVRLTEKGRVQAARLNVAKTSGSPTSPSEQKQSTCVVIGYKEAQRQMLVMYDAREPYTSYSDLMKRTGARSKSTISRAFKDSPTLKAWKERSSTRKTAPPAIGFNEVQHDRAIQNIEDDPANFLPKEDVDTIMTRLINEEEEKGNTENVIWLKSLTPEERHSLVLTCQNQNFDEELSPLEPDPRGRRCNPIEHKTL